MQPACEGPQEHCETPRVKEADERLQCLDRLRGEEEKLEAYEGDAVVVHVRRAVEVGIDDDSPEPVVEMSQGVRFLCELVFARNRVGRLNVEALRAVVGDEVDLGLCGRLHAILQRIGVYDADIDGIASPFQLVVDNVLHQVDVGRIGRSIVIIMWIVSKNAVYECL